MSTPRILTGLAALALAAGGGAAAVSAFGPEAAAAPAEASDFSLSDGAQLIMDDDDGDPSTPRTGQLVTADGTTTDVVCELDPDLKDGDQVDLVLLSVGDGNSPTIIRVVQRPASSATAGAFAASTGASGYRGVNYFTVFNQAIANGGAGGSGGTGTDGSNGTDGTNDSNGTDGADGTNDSNDSNGTDGADGADGADGTDGTDGSLVDADTNNNDLDLFNGLDIDVNEVLGIGDIANDSANGNDVLRNLDIDVKEVLGIDDTIDVRNVHDVVNVGNEGILDGGIANGDLLNGGVVNGDIADGGIANGLDARDLDVVDIDDTNVGDVVRNVGNDAGIDIIDDVVNDTNVDVDDVVDRTKVDVDRVVNRTKVDVVDDVTTKVRSPGNVRVIQSRALSRVRRHLENRTKTRDRTAAGLMGLFGSGRLVSMFRDLSSALPSDGLLGAWIDHVRAAAATSGTGATATAGASATVAAVVAPGSVAASTALASQATATGILAAKVGAAGLGLVLSVGAVGAAANLVLAPARDESAAIGEASARRHRSGRCRSRRCRHERRRDRRTPDRGGRRAPRPARAAVHDDQ